MAPTDIHSSALPDQDAAASGRAPYEKPELKSLDTQRTQGKIFNTTESSPVFGPGS